MKISKHSLRQFLAKFFLLAVVVLPSALSAAAQSDVKEALVVYMTNSSKYTYILEAQPSVKFSDTELLINGPQISDTHNISDVERFTFEKVSSVSEIRDKYEIRITVTDNAVTISGLKPGTVVTAADIQGHIVASLRADADGAAAISTENFVPGVYIITSAGGHSFKFYKR